MFIILWNISILHLILALVNPGRSGRLGSRVAPHCIDERGVCSPGTASPLPRWRLAPLPLPAPLPAA